MPIVGADGALEGTMPPAWEPEQSSEQWSDTEAWRGELHQADDEGWRGETLATWGDDDTAESDAEDDWRQDSAEAADWPEDWAGPEYWLFKRDGL
jgi:hypothetical protein